MQYTSADNDVINLLVTIDSNYLHALITMLRSYINVHPSDKTDLYIAHSSLTQKDFKILEKEAEGSGVTVYPIKIEHNYFSDTPVLERLPEESFYRLLAFDFLPDSVERCLYLDPDIYILRPLHSLYNIDMGKNMIAAGSHLHGFLNILSKTRIGGVEHSRYVNSGVLLIDVAKIRQSFTAEEVLSSLEKNVQRLLLGDQDMVNILFSGKILIFDEKIYNLDEKSYDYYNRNFGFDFDDVKGVTAIIHYNGKYKPWLENYKGVLDTFYPEIKEKKGKPDRSLKKQVKAIWNIVKPDKKQALTILIILIFLIAMLICYIISGKEMAKIVTEPNLLRGWLEQFGAFDEVIFILIRAAQTVFKFIPAEPLEIGSGYVWGAVPGMFYCVIGNMLGTLAIFALTKKFGKKLINILFPRNDKKIIDTFNKSTHIYWLLFFLYLIPGSPKDGLTYFVALTPVKKLPFMIMTFIARLPSVFSSTICGEVASEGQYALSLIIFLITIVFAALGGLIYRSYSKKKAKQLDNTEIK